MHSPSLWQSRYLPRERVPAVGAGSSTHRARHLLRTLPGGFPSDLTATAMHHMPPRNADTMAEVARRLSIGALSAVGFPGRRGRVPARPRTGRAPAIIDTHTLDAIRNRTSRSTRHRVLQQGGVRRIDGESLRPDVIICATGYRHGLEPLVGHLDMLDSGDYPWTTVRALPIARSRFFGFQSVPASSAPSRSAHVASRRPSARMSPIAAEKLRFQDEAGYERPVLGVRPVLAGSPLRAFPAPHVTTYRGAPG